MFPGKTLDEVWSCRCADLTRARDRLSLVSSQDALSLLRASFSAPKVQHLLRCSPSTDLRWLDKFDDLLKSSVSSITNNALSETQWLQATLPIKDGGLGIRRVASLALPAFLASAASTLQLQDHILASTHISDDPLAESLKSLWEATFGPSPAAQSAHRQSSWDRPGVLAAHAKVEEARSSPFQRAGLLAARAPHSGDWLFALPISACGLRLDDEAVRVAVALRLGIALGSAHICRCGANVDPSGVHSLTCRHAPGRAARHHALNDCIFRALGAAGIPSSKEPSGLVRSDGKRPDGCTLIPWCSGKALTWDVTVACTVADSYIQDSSRASGAVAELAATRKEVKYSVLAGTHIFQPLAFESHGPQNASAISFIKGLGHRISQRSGDDREAQFLFQRLSVTLQRFNAILFGESFLAASDDPDM